MTEGDQPQPAWRRALDWRTPGWCQESGVHWESWSLNGEACITGLDPPFAGGARLASCLTWLVRSFASQCRRTHDATGAFALTCASPRMPSTLAVAMSASFDLALRDPRLIRERVRRRGGDPAACRWPAFWLEGEAYDYVIASLEARPDPPTRPSGSMVSREGVAAAALTVRWGSYLAVLLDHDKPLWPDVQSARTSRISDAEMARINIEASAALAEWIDIDREDPGGRLYEQLVNRAVAYLPMPKKTSKLTVTEFGGLAQPEMAARVVEVAGPTRLERVRAEVERHPSRVLANALLNTAWRNGPVEHIRAGDLRECPLDQRRITPAEERELMAFASERLALGMTVCLQFASALHERRFRTCSAC